MGTVRECKVVGNSNLVRLRRRTQRFPVATRKICACTLCDQEAAA